MAAAASIRTATLIADKLTFDPTRGEPAAFDSASSAVAALGALRAHLAEKDQLVDLLTAQRAAAKQREQDEIPQAPAGAQLFTRGFLCRAPTVWIENQNPKAPGYERPDWPELFPYLAEMTPAPLPGRRVSRGWANRTARENARLAKRGVRDAYQAAADAVTLAARSVCVTTQSVMDGTSVPLEPVPAPAFDAAPPAGRPDVPLVSTTTTNSTGENPRVALPGDPGLAALDRYALESSAGAPARSIQANACLEAADEEEKILAPLRVAFHAARARVEAFDRRWDDDGGARGTDDEELYRAEMAFRRQEKRVALCLSAAARLESCGQKSTLGLCPADGGVVLQDDGFGCVRGSRCEKWGCPNCDKARSAERAERLVKRVEAWQKRNIRLARAEKRGCDRPKMLTLTIRHNASQTWVSVYTRLREAFARLRRGTEWGRYVDGYAARYETTHGENGWHVHLHILIVGTFWPVEGRWRLPDETRELSGRRVNALGLVRETGLRDTWKTITDGEGSEDIGAMETADSIREVCKYVVKPSERLTTGNRVELVRGLLQRRTFETGGCLRSVDVISELDPTDAWEPRCPCCGRVFSGGAGLWFVSSETYSRHRTRGVQQTGPP